MRNRATSALMFSQVHVLGSKCSESRSRQAHSWPHGLGRLPQKWELMNWRINPGRKDEQRKQASASHRKRCEPWILGTGGYIFTLGAKTHQESPLLNTWKWLDVLLSTKLASHGTPKWRQKSQAIHAFASPLCPLPVWCWEANLVCTSLWDVK